MKTTRTILISFLLLGFGGCGDDSPPSPTPPDEDNKSTTSPEPHQVWFGPPADADVILALRPSDIDNALHRRLPAWVTEGLDRNVTAPDPLSLDAFSKSQPVYFYVQGTETGMVGHSPATVDGNLSLPGFTIATEGDHRVIVSGESSESSAKAQSILSGHAASDSGIRAFSENFPAVGLFLPETALVVDLRSDHGSLAVKIRSLRAKQEIATPSQTSQWDVIPAEATAFFGSSGKNTLLGNVGSFVLGRIYADMDIEHNASHSWAESLARLFDSGGTPGKALENPTGGLLFALAPPTEANTSFSPFPMPAKLKGAEAALLIDFQKLGPLLRADSSSLLDRPTVALACERVKLLTIGGDSRSLDLELTWMDENSDGLSTLSTFLDELSRRLRSRHFCEAVLRDDLATVQKILETIDPSSLNLVGRISPLHFSAWQGKLPALGMCLHRGIDVDLNDDSNRTALHMAAWSSNPEAVLLLLDYNATVDAPNASGATPAMEAARIGNPVTLKLLLASGADINATDTRGNGLVEYAASSGHKALVSILKRRGSGTKKPLHVAAGIGDLTALQALVEDANDTNVPDGWGATPLLYAASGGQSKTFAFLLAKGANPRAKDEQGLTLVHAAAISGNSEILARTLALKLDVNARHTERGATPLDWAIASKDGGVADSLRSAGAKTGWQLEIAPK